MDSFKSRQLGVGDKIFTLKRPNDRLGVKDANKAGPAVLRAKLLYVD